MSTLSHYQLYSERRSTAHTIMALQIVIWLCFVFLSTASWGMALHQQEIVKLVSEGGAWAVVGVLLIGIAAMWKYYTNYIKQQDEKHVKEKKRIEQRYELTLKERDEKIDNLLAAIRSEQVARENEMKAEITQLRIKIQGLLESR